VALDAAQPPGKAAAGREAGRGGGGGGGGGGGVGVDPAELTRGLLLHAAAAAAAGANDDGGRGNELEGGRGRTGEEAVARATAEGDGEEARGGRRRRGFSGGGWAGTSAGGSLAGLEEDGDEEADRDEAALPDPNRGGPAASDGECRDGVGWREARPGQGCLDRGGLRMDRVPGPGSGDSMDAGPAAGGARQEWAGEEGRVEAAARAPLEERPEAPQPRKHEPEEAQPQPQPQAGWRRFLGPVANGRS
jgi:hypothetical protein